MAFAHGSNDVANAVGPLAAALKVMGVLGAEVPVWVLAMGGLGMVIGIVTWGYKVVETIGLKITELTPTRGFSAEFATASVVLFQSYSSVPISTTHTCRFGDRSWACRRDCSR
jgi:inorganic phosphate transporter, PiT family